jgi:hypothetical protein
MGTTQQRQPEAAARWWAALARAIDSGIDALAIGGSDSWAIESGSVAGLVYIVDAAGTSCGCAAALAGDVVCRHRALARFLAGTLALPLVACGACLGSGYQAVGVGGWEDSVRCDGCDGRGQVEQSLSSLAAEAPRRMAPRKERPAAERVSA